MCGAEWGVSGLMNSARYSMLAHCGIDDVRLARKCKCEEFGDSNSGTLRSPVSRA